MKTAVSVATLLARRQAASSPSVAIFFENVVMNAVESAPSANRSRNRFGRRKAIRKASRSFPAPKSPAKICSRIRPRTRLERTASPTTPVARVLIFRSCAEGIGEQNQRLGLFQRKISGYIVALALLGESELLDFDNLESAVARERRWARPGERRPPRRNMSCLPLR